MVRRRLHWKPKSAVETEKAAIPNIMAGWSNDPVFPSNNPQSGPAADAMVADAAQTEAVEAAILDALSKENSAIRSSFSVAAANRVEGAMEDCGTTGAKAEAVPTTATASSAMEVFIFVF